MEVLKTTSLELVCPVLVVQQTKKDYLLSQYHYNPRNNNQIETGGSTTAYCCLVRYAAVKDDEQPTCFNGQSREGNCGHLTNVWKKTSQRGTCDK